jgi:hypothetical protein
MNFTQEFDVNVQILFAHEFDGEVQMNFTHEFDVKIQINFTHEFDIKVQINLTQEFDIKLQMTHFTHETHFYPRAVTGNEAHARRNEEFFHVVIASCPLTDGELSLV